MKIAVVRTIFTAPPVTKEIPRAIFSGMLSMTEPTSSDNRDADFPPPALYPWDLFLFLTALLLLASDFDFDFLSFLI
jgi:hypothetical protein